MIKSVAFIFLAVLSINLSFSQSVSSKDMTLPNDVIYKIVDGDTLKMRFMHPDKKKKRKKYPTMIFFFGGGWNGGSITQFEEQAKYFASRGMITILADYRVKSRQKTTPFEAVKDAKSAVRFLRINAKKHGINTKKIVVAGGSAGGHLAAATTVLSGLNESGEDLTVSAKGNALILFNPVIDNGPEGYGYERVKERYLEISPMHNIKKGEPPTIFFIGDKDKHIPISTAKEYKSKMEAVGSRCDLFIYEGEEHGFFNVWKKDKEYYNITVREADLFLKSIKFLKGKCSI